MKIAVNLPQSEKEHDVLSSLWARKKIDHLMAEDWTGLQGGEPKGDLKLQITKLGLEHRLMTQFTSFVAVEEQQVTEGGEVKTVQVPVELPEGVKYERIFGKEKDSLSLNGRNYQALVMTRSAATQTVEVSAASPMIDTKSSSVNYTVTPSAPLPGGYNGPSKSKKSGRDLLEEKADKDVLAAWDCHVVGASSPGCKDSKEKIHVRIEASAVTEELKKKLAKLGFVQDANTDGKTLIGMLPVTKVKQVTAFSEVTAIKLVQEQARK
jgi:Ca-activated chloride channel homolog